MRSGFAGIDLAFAKRKRLPVALCTWQQGRLVPERLRSLPFSPPRGSGNAAVLSRQVVSDFADATAKYLVAVCDHLGIRPERIAIDAPSAPRAEGSRRRAAEVAMDRAAISCFATPSARDFERILDKVRKHLRDGGRENRIPHANQLWMLVGFEVFQRLGEIAPCIEVFPQATARVLGSGQVHKSRVGGVEAQLIQVARHTGWPSGRPEEPDFTDIAFAPAHDRLDAYLSAWVAALPPENRIAFGEPPDDVIWAPRLGGGDFETLASSRRVKQRRGTGSAVGELHRRLCPACGQHEFRRWPFGWDAHAAHRCKGLTSSSPQARKAEFKSRFGHTF